MILASFTVPCSPVAKGRPRFRRMGKHVSTYSPAATRGFEAMIADQARAAVGPIDPYRGAVELEAHFALPVPKSWRKRDREAALAGTIMPQVKPDLDNFAKAVADALNSIVYVDDGQIVSARLTKRYGNDTGITITARACG